MKGAINYTEDRLVSLYGRIHRSAYVPTEATALYRILLACFLLLVEFNTFGWLVEVPDALFTPQRVSPYYYLSGFPPRWAIDTCIGVMLFSIVGIGAGIRARWSAWGYCFAFVIIRGYANSLGKIGHGMLLPTIVFCFSLTNWGTVQALLPDRPWRRGHWGASLAAIAICFGLFSAGWPKLLGWVDFDTGTSGFLNWFASGYYGGGRRHFLADLVPNFPAWSFELLDYGAVLFELSGFLFLFWGPRAWRCWLLVAAGFHLSTLLLLNIGFLPHVGIYAGFLLYPAVRQVYPSRSVLWAITLLLTLVAGSRFAWHLSGIPVRFFPLPSSWVGEAAPLWLTLIAWVALLITGGLSWLRYADISRR